MSGTFRISDLLSYVTVALSIAVVVRLLVQRLVATYAFVAAYLVVVAIQGAVPWFVANGTDLYSRLYFLTEGTWVALSALVVLDLYGAVLKDLPGLASVARKFIQWALGLSVVVSLSLLYFEQMSRNLLVDFFIFERIITTSLLILVFLITAFLSYYPVQLGRNTIVYTIGYTVLFMARSSGLFLLDAQGSVWLSRVSLGFQLIDCICLGLWAVMLTAEGQQKVVRFGHQWRREDEEKLLAQLNALNVSLLRVAKK